MPAARARLGQALVIAQVAVALVLLGCAGLFVRTLYKLNSLDAGFSRNGVLLMTISAALPRVSEPPTPEAVMAEMSRVGGIWQSLVERMAAEPGVNAVAAATLSPLSGRDRGVRIVVVGGAPVSEAQEGIHLNHVTAGYFDVSGLRALSGRVFTDSDRSGSLRVAILNQTAAREYFGSANPIGWKVKFSGSRAAFEYEIVGVVNDSRYESLRKADERMVYLPMTQPIDRVSQVFLAIRGSGDAPALLEAARNDVRVVVPGGFVVGSTTMAQRISDSLVQERLVALLATAFGVLALALACIGLYGVFSYVVTQRTREIGIRMAVGAQRTSVVWLILRETLLLVAIGIAVGLPLIWVAGHYVESQLFGVMSRDALASRAPSSSSASSRLQRRWARRFVPAGSIPSTRCVRNSCDQSSGGSPLGAIFTMRGSKRASGSTRSLCAAMTSSMSL